MVLFRLSFIMPAFVLFAFVARADDPKPAKNIDEKYQALETFATAIHYLETMYVDPEKVTLSKTVHHALDGVVSQLDPHTVILEKKAFAQLTSDTKGEIGGVGIIVSQENEKLMVISTMDGTPAQRAGMKSGDEIIAIENIPLAKIKAQKAVEMMRGEPGSVLKLRVMRKAVKDPIDFDLRREVIKIPSTKTYVLADGVLYIRIASFNENTNAEAQAFLEKHQKSLKGLILDLRDNPGGLLDQSVKIVDLFIESGLIVSTVGRTSDRIEREFATKRNTFSGFPMVVLVNGGSASASEIVAGALQDHQRALVMGNKTFGKGSVQTLVTLPDGSGLKMTIARYYTPKDRSIQAKGITPDVVVNANSTTDEANRKKEIDLKGHIEGNDLSDIAEKTSMLVEVQDWPENMRTDNQLTTAFTYLRAFIHLKGWSQIMDKPQAAQVNAPEGDSMIAALPTRTTVAGGPQILARTLAQPRAL